MRLKRILAVCLSTTFSFSLFAVSLSIGNHGLTPNGGDLNTMPVRTDVDLANPASHTGEITSVSVYWSSSGCTNAFSIKFLRRVGDTLTVIDERGPFTPPDNLSTLTMSPPVAVRQGDLIGVTRLANCGNAGSVDSSAGEGYLQYAGDLHGSVAIADAAGRSTSTLVLGGSGNVSESVVEVIPIVGSVAGAFDSHFKTAMQILAPGDGGATTTTLVFHRTGVPASSGDTSMTINLTRGVMFTSDDIVAAMGLSGTGSMDVSEPVGVIAPVIFTRVYNDAGTDGTSGLSEEPVTTDTAAVNVPLLARGTVGYLATPHDPVRTRFNVGVRTLYSGASLSITVRSSTGAPGWTLTRDYPAGYFIQTDAATFMGGALAADQSIEIDVTHGSAIVYGSTTDNTTNDPAIKFAYPTYTSF